MRIKVLLGAAAMLLSIPGARAADCSVTLPVRDTGWYDAGGFHDPLNVNFFAGYQASSQSEFRNWFVFDLPALAGTVVAAELRLYTFAIQSTNSSETFEVHHVATAPSILTNGGTGMSAVFDDLGDGPIYATQAIAVTQAYSFISLPLNSNAIAAIRASSGQPFAIGGRIAMPPPVPPYATNDTQLFGFSYAAGDFVQLKLAITSTNSPTVITQPPAIVYAASGSTAVLDVDACGATPLRYQWFFNDLPLPNQTNPRLVLAGVVSNSAGAYFAVVSNMFGATTTLVTRLFVDVQPAAIILPPADATVHVGGTAQFIASVQGSPAPVVQWSFNGAAIPGATNQSLIIPNVQSSNAGNYTITASNVLGGQSRSATLTVEPLLIGGPADLVLDSGTDGALSAAVLSTLPRTFQWRRDGTNLPALSAPYLPFFDARSASAGNYDVIVSNSAGSRTSRLARVTVTNTAPRLFGPNSLSIPIGATIPLAVSAAGSRPMQLQWYFGGVAIPSATNEQLFIENSTASNEGAYYVVLSNAFGVVTSSVATVALALQPPQIYSLTPEKKSAFAGDFDLFTAYVEGSPSAVQWRFNGADIPGATNTSLFFPSLTASQEGSYELIATNLRGTNLSGIDLTVARARALDRWTGRNPHPQGNDLEHLAFANGRYVAAGEGGSLVTSTNGFDWSAVSLGQRYAVRAITADNALFAAIVGEPGNPGILLLSLDGSNWTPREIPGFTSITALEFLNGAFHVFGYSGLYSRLATSTDGVTWTATAPRDLTAPPSFAAYGNGRYVTASPAQVAVSTDGTNFTQQFLPDPTIHRLRFVNGAFMAVSGAGIIWRSPDGAHWTPQSLPAELELEGAAYGNGRFVVVGEDGTLIASTDGQTWTASDPGTGKNLKDVLFDGNQFVVCGNDGVLLTSANGLDWTDWRRGNTEDLYGVVYTNGLFVAVGYRGTVLTSSNAVDWIVRPTPTSRDLHGITYAAGQFVAVGRRGTVLTSPDGINWAARATSTTNYLQRVTHGNGRFVVAASPATILTSTDAITWDFASALPIPAATEVEDVTFGDGKFVAVGGYFGPGAKSVILLSTNGFEWASLPNVDFGVILRGVTYGSGRFFAVGNDGRIAFSTNAVNWQGELTPAPYHNLRHVLYAAGRYIAVGNNGSVLSHGPVEPFLMRHRSIVSENLHDIAYGQGKLVAVGNAGTIVEATDVLPRLGPWQLDGGSLRFTITGGIAPFYRVEASSNLLQWETVGGYQNDGEPADYAWETNAPLRFYRVLSP